MNSPPQTPDKTSQNILQKSSKKSSQSPKSDARVHRATLAFLLPQDQLNFDEKLGKGNHGFKKVHHHQFGVTDYIFQPQLKEFTFKHLIQGFDGRVQEIPNLNILQEALHEDQCVLTGVTTGQHESYLSLFLSLPKIVTSFGLRNLPPEGINEGEEVAHEDEERVNEGEDEEKVNEHEAEAKAKEGEEEVTREEEEVKEEQQVTSFSRQNTEIIEKRKETPDYRTGLTDLAHIPKSVVQLIFNEPKYQGMLRNFPDNENPEENQN